MIGPDLAPDGHPAMTTKAGVPRHARRRFVAGRRILDIGDRVLARIVARDD
jgi:hypothetical protein